MRMPGSRAKADARQKRRCMHGCRDGKKDRTLSCQEAATLDMHKCLTDRREALMRMPGSRAKADARRTRRCVTK